MTWQQEIKNMIVNGCSDSDIEDFVVKHSEVKGTTIWDYVYEYFAPEVCHGCKYIQMEDMYPCDRCSRRVVKDYYEAR